MTDDPFKDYLTVGEVAEMFGVEKQTVRLWIKEGRLAAIRKGHGVVLIHTSALNGFVPPQQAWFDAVRAVVEANKVARKTNQ